METHEGGVGATIDPIGPGGAVGEAPEARMFNATSIVIDSFVERLQRDYVRNYGRLEESYGEILAWAGRMALERIAQTDTFYHTVEHTIMVTLVGQEILIGKHIREGGVSPRGWLHFVISLLCHDIGYVKGVCRADDGRRCATGRGDDMVGLPPGSTDASLTPYHIDRGITFIHERFGGHDVIDAEVIAQAIELTRFPTPEDSDCPETGDFRGLVRAADLIGQMADPNYLRKLPALFREFEETGMNDRLGYKDADDLRRNYPDFFWNVVHRYIGDALGHLAVTQEGRQWTANLYAHVFATEHGA